MPDEYGSNTGGGLTGPPGLVAAMELGGWASVLGPGDPCPLVVGDGNWTRCAKPGTAAANQRQTINKRRKSRRPTGNHGSMVPDARCRGQEMIMTTWCPRLVTFLLSALDSRRQFRTCGSYQWLLRRSRSAAVAASESRSPRFVFTLWLRFDSANCTRLTGGRRSSPAPRRPCSSGSFSLSPRQRSL
jgi:hypothetical protein